VFVVEGLVWTSCKNTVTWLWCSLFICEALDTESEVFEALLLKNINIIFVALGVTARHIATSTGLQRNFDISVQTMVWEHGTFHLTGWVLYGVSGNMPVCWGGHHNLEARNLCAALFITWCISFCWLWLLFLQWNQFVKRLSVNWGTFACAVFSDS